MARVFDNDIRQTAEREYSHIREKYYKMLHESSQPLFNNLSREQKNELYNSGFYNLIEGGDKIVNCAFLLSMNIVKEAINYSETHGGGVAAAACRIGAARWMTMTNAGGDAASERLPQ